MFEQKFQIIDINCDACVKLSESALKKIPGAELVEIKAATGEAVLRAKREISFEEIATALKRVDKHVKNN